MSLPRHAKYRDSGLEWLGPLSGRLRYSKSRAALISAAVTGKIDVRDITALMAQSKTLLIAR